MNKFNLFVCIILFFSAKFECSREKCPLRADIISESFIPFNLEERFVLVWYGVVWYGMVWYGMVWYGMVWYGMVWYAMEWYTVWYGGL